MATAFELIVCAKIMDVAPHDVRAHGDEVSWSERILAKFKMEMPDVWSDLKQFMQPRAAGDLIADMYVRANMRGSSTFNGRR